MFRILTAMVLCMLNATTPEPVCCAIALPQFPNQTFYHFTPSSDCEELPRAMRFGFGTREIVDYELCVLNTEDLDTVTDAIHPDE